MPDISISDIMHSWRSFTAHEANMVLGRTGQFWMEEYFDRYIRDAEHLDNTVRYIRNNPVKAGLVSEPELWPWTGDGTQASRLRNNSMPSAAGNGTQASRLRNDSMPSAAGETPAYQERDWQLLLFKKTQKLLDRLLFIFFAEDCGLLPPNSMRQIIEQWEKLSELDAYVPLYERIKKYFGYMNTGFQGKKYEIFAYNGGLFKPDEVLDNITISDTVLVKHTKKLSRKLLDKCH